MAPTPEFTFLGFRYVEPRSRHLLGSSSFVSLADSKYSGRAIRSVHELTPYAYDPSGDGNEPMDGEDLLYDPRAYVAYKEDMVISQGSLTITL